MAKVEIEINDDYQLFLLCSILAGQAQDHDKKAYEWLCGPGGSKDAVYDRLMKDSVWLLGLAKSIARGVKIPMGIGEKSTGPTKINEVEMLRKHFGYIPDPRGGEVWTVYRGETLIVVHPERKPRIYKRGRVAFMELELDPFDTLPNSGPEKAT